MLELIMEDNNDEKWVNILAVDKMQEFMKSHVLEPITLLDLGRCSNYSPFYSAKIFKQLTGKSPFEYLRILRLSQAALKLRDKDEKVINVAFNFVFDSHEGFTRAFSKQFGITPNKYRKNPIPIKLFLPNPIIDSYKMKYEREHDMNIDDKCVIFSQVIERPKRKMILRRGIKAEDYIEYVDEVGEEIWGILYSINEALFEPVGMWLPESMHPEGTSHYAQGVEVPFDYNGLIPTGFEIIDLPPCKLMFFQGPPFDDENFDNAVNLISKKVENYNPEISGFKWAIKDAPHIQLEPQGYRGYIEAKPVRQINE